MTANKDLEIFFYHFRFRNGKANGFAKIFFHICFRNEHLGGAQATIASHTYKNIIQIPEIFFAFAFVIHREKIHNPGIVIVYLLVTVSVTTVILVQNSEAKVWLIA